MPGNAALLEELAANAWPASALQYVDGWRLRCTPGVQRRRSNSVLPPADPYVAGRPSVPMVLKIAAEFYARRRMPMRIQVAPAEHQRRLDKELAGAGLLVEAPTIVLAARTEDLVAPSGVDTPVQVGARDTEWMRAWQAVEDRPDVEAVGHLVLDRIGPLAAYAAVRADDRIVAVGMAVVERGWAGVFCMGTVAGHRRRGYARAVLGGLAAWASAYGATSIYLQVEASNTAALSFYAKAGFGRSHGYHYRAKPGPARLRP